MSENRLIVTCPKKLRYHLPLVLPGFQSRNYRYALWSYGQYEAACCVAYMTRPSSTRRSCRFAMGSRSQ
jgi:hypothetical protein